MCPARLARAVREVEEWIGSGKDVRLQTSSHPRPLGWEAGRRMGDGVGVGGKVVGFVRKSAGGAGSDYYRLAMQVRATRAVCCWYKTRSQKKASRQAKILQAATTGRGLLLLAPCHPLFWIWGSVSKSRRLCGLGRAGPS